MWVFSQRKSKPSFRKEPCQGFRAWHQSQASYQSGVSRGWVFQVKGLSFVRRQTLSHSLLAQWSLVRKQGGPWKKDQAMPLKPGLTSDASSHWAYRFSANCLFQSAYVLCQHAPRMLPAKQKRGYSAYLRKANRDPLQLTTHVNILPAGLWVQLGTDQVTLYLLSAVCRRGSCWPGHSALYAGRGPGS